MTRRSPTTTLAIVGRSSSRQPRTYRLEGRPMAPQRSAAYRRLAAAMLGLDVASLAATLRSTRLGTTEDKPLAA
jgi:hypothetical protein